MKKYDYIVKGKITTLDREGLLDFSILCEYALDTDVIREIINKGYVKIDSADMFVPYHAISSIKIVEFDYLDKKDKQHRNKYKECLKRMTEEDLLNVERLLEEDE
ncbi:MAG: hypothetical protein RSC24_06355 [Clostridium sp.]